MILNEDALKNGWVVSEEDPGYLTKTLQHGNCTIIINRPILDPAEQKKREQQLCRDLERGLQDYYARKGRKA